ncbi:MAG: FMN-binding protein [Planctomycetes bacterium]|nr:FMN-binding protein [Planctomycetota bacterium]
MYRQMTFRGGLCFLALAVVGLLIVPIWLCGCCKQDATNAGAVTSGEKSRCFRDGQYVGVARGYGGPIRVKVSINVGQIKRIEIVEQSESMTQGALEKIPRRIVEKQTVQNIDTVTGASLTSKAVLKAVERALEKAESK